MWKKVERLWAEDHGRLSGWFCELPSLHQPMHKANELSRLDNVHLAAGRLATVQRILARDSAIGRGTSSGNSLNADCRSSRLETKRLLGNGQPSSRWLIADADSEVWRAFEKENNRSNRSEIII
jgi:hypothetical protein